MIERGAYAHRVTALARLADVGGRRRLVAEMGRAAPAGDPPLPLALRRAVAALLVDARRA